MTIVMLSFILLFPVVILIMKKRVLVSLGVVLMYLISGVQIMNIQINNSYVLPIIYLLTVGSGVYVGFIFELFVKVYARKIKNRKEINKE